MFRAGQPNTYDEIVAKTTDENLTGENWELILNLCDKVQEEGEQGARNVLAAAIKRLAHRNPNVQLYTLTLVEALSKNCGVEVHREIASRAFTQCLEKLVTDRTTHDKVRKRVLNLVAVWTAEFEKDPTLGLMEECYENLKSRGYKFETPDEPPPPDVDDEVRRREEEELQRALEISMQDKGGRSQWEAYSLASSSGAGASGAGSSRQASSSTSGPSGSSSRPAPSSSNQTPTYGGYVPSAATPAVSAMTQPSYAAATPANAPPVSSSPVSVHSQQENIPIVTRVRALHTFTPTEPGELAFEKGDIIKVVDRNYKDWWRGQLKGRTGIFPVNYVEPLPEPTAAEIAREAEQEAQVFAQAANVDRLLTMLRNMDPARDNLADNEEIQELYRSCMTLRPKIVKLIDKYSQKRADLVSMNETFVKARTIFDRMMEESLARHTGVYDGRPSYVQTPSQPYIARPDSRGRQEFYPPGGPPVAPGAPQAYGWNPAVYDQPGYNAYPAPPAAYSGPAPVAESPYPPPAQGHPHPPAAPAQPYPDPNAYAGRPQSVYAPPPQTYGAQPPYAPGPEPQGYPVSPVMQAQQPQPGPQFGQKPVEAQHQHQHQPQTQSPMQVHAQPQQQPQQPFVQQQPAMQPDSQAPLPSPQPHAQTQPETQPQLQPQTQTQPQPQSQPQPQPQQEPSPNPSQGRSGPPYVYDPNGTYPDPNVQAWAQYYAHGGTDPTGAVYFISVPGVKEGPQPVSRTQSTDSANQEGAPSEQTGQVAPLHINKAQVVAEGQQGAQQPQAGMYGASPYAPAAGDGSPVVGQQYYGLTNQFAGMDINADGRQNGPSGPQGVGAPA
ncbi:hypothetical protein PYCCODRAFT_1405847 [Trametes coccinea BRFM310]|uniref:Class E vacuolar protein-sorting machinery protein HSE1 n=1 Tax=Trametes coccinea (strain BRFM310) TaxID=1353009 RepID=A0A1Y2IXD7_TRAC3|nr:hypothetical protein PYCCODRAFT_1405847 [Trametes coccinea BRFM310]